MSPSANRVSHPNGARAPSGSRIALALGLVLLLACGSEESEVPPRPAADAASAPDDPSAPAPPASGDWMSRVQQGLAQKEYEASPNQGGLQAPNRAQNLRTYFGEGGVRVHDRTASGTPQLLSLSLAGVGRAGKVEPVPDGEVVAEGVRVEIRRPGLVEWYLNTPEGLEQGFDLSERPEGKGSLWLDLAVEGARASQRGEEVIFATATGRKLSYGNLVVMDADGRRLVARLQVPRDSTVRVIVEDADAKYPIRIDPLLTATP